MAIIDYSSLIDEVGLWLDRDDLSAQIPSFIMLAEINFKTDLRLRLMEKTVSVPMAIGQSSYAISALFPRFQQMRSVRVDKPGERKALSYYSPETLYSLWGNSQNGEPMGYTLLGDQLLIYPAPSSVWAVDLEVTYFEQSEPLSLSEPINALLSAYPNIYLFGTLLQAEPFLKDDARIEIWGTYYKNAVQRAMAGDGRGTLTGSPIEDSGRT